MPYRFIFHVVPRKRFELSHLLALVPKTSVSTVPPTGHDRYLYASRLAFGLYSFNGVNGGPSL